MPTSHAAPDRLLADLMTWNLVTIDCAANLGRATEVMEAARISSVLVTEFGKPVGIVTERDILHALDTAVPREQTVASVMGRPLVSARKDLTVHDAYHLMAQKAVRHLLVTDAFDRSVGIVSESDFRIHLGLEFFRRLQNVRSVMTARMPVLAPTALVREAVSAMALRDANCAVVALDGKPAGMITERDAVRLYREGAASLDRMLRDVMSSPVTTIAEGTRLYDAMELMQAQRVRHLVVVTEDGQVAGVLSEHDVVRQLETEYLEFALRDSRRTRRQLQESEMRRRAVFDQVREYVSIVELDGTVRDVNRAALELAGDPNVVELIDKPLWNTPWWSHDPTLQARLRQAFADLASGHPSRFEATHPAADGELRYVDFQLHPILDEAGRLALALAEASDVTERKRAEAELRQYQWAVEQCPVSIIITDAEARIEYVNPKFTEITGYGRKEVLGQNPRLLKSGTTPPATYEQLWATLKRGEVWAGELCNRRKSGEAFWEYARILPVAGPDGKTARYLAVKEDITQRRQVEEQRRLAARVFESTHDGVFISDAEGVILDVNQAFCNLTGYSRHEAVGRSFRLLDSGHHDEAFYEKMDLRLAERGHWVGELWVRTKDGAIGVVLMTVSLVRDAAGQTTHRVGVFTDITQRKETEQRLEHLAHHDALTDLPNRSLFRDRLQQAIKKSQRDKQAVALLFIDLDRFKEVNDTLGHVAGDRLLIDAAQRISSRVRSSDTVARLGGDEFAAVLQGVESREAAARVARDIIDALTEPFPFNDETVRISASIGIAICADDEQDPESLTHAADRAMYAAKSQGRNRFVFAPSGDAGKPA
ncbi:MAG TPA: PAS domain S-box protein [Rhodocyclaceae bacterium]